MKLQEVKQSQAYRLFNPGCVVLVTVGDGLELIHHLGGNKFAVSDRVIVGKIPS